MSSPLEPQQILHHCMQHIEGAGNAMADDMNDAAMKLNAAMMMLSSACHAVSMRAAELEPPAQPGTGAT
jgi:hypothetical protein